MAVTNRYAAARSRFGGLPGWERLAILGIVYVGIALGLVYGLGLEPGTMGSNIGIGELPVGR